MMKKMILLIAAFAFGVLLWSSNPALSDTADAKKPVTFAKDVAPILQQKCQECHRQGGMAPMSLMTFEEVRPWARSIKEKTIKRQMPPFDATGEVGRYHEDPRLTDAEIATISNWVDGGAAKGSSKDLPAPRSWRTDWRLGTPDVALALQRPYTVKASQTDQYVFFFFDYVFPEDTWIRSIETRPGNIKAVHHANVHLVPPGIKIPAEGYIAGDFDPSARGTIMISGWAPGVNPVNLTPGTAVRIPKGMRLGIQIHYAPTGKETTDQTQVGIFHADGIIKKNLRVMMGDDKKLEIPAGEGNYVVTDKRTFDQDAIVRFFHVHMHLRGKSYTMKFHYPDGRVETGIEVPDYDFNWQRTYVLTEPMRVPKGTWVEFVAVYDNSAKNRFNPDPSKVVHWGEKTSDEMMQGRIFYEYVNENLNVKVVKGRAVAMAESASKGS